MEVGWRVVRDFMEVLEAEGGMFALYRGHADSSRKLIPSAYRPGSYGITDPRHLQEWKREAARFALHVPRDNVEWLILAQHFGMPTALLDWTTSPLVALFFACDGDEHAKADGCILRGDQKQFDEPLDNLTVDVFAPSRAKPLMINGVGSNARSTAQDSILSLHTKSDYAMPHVRSIFTVPADKKKSTLDALKKLGFTGERLHFDITKLVARIKRDRASRTISAGAPPPKTRKAPPK